MILNIDPYDLDTFRCLTRVVWPHGGWIVWNWIDCRWDHQSNEWMIERCYPTHRTLEQILKDPSIPNPVKDCFIRAREKTLKELSFSVTVDRIQANHPSTSA